MTWGLLEFAQLQRRAAFAIGLMANRAELAPVMSADRNSAQARIAVVDDLRDIVRRRIGDRPR